MTVKRKRAIPELGKLTRFKEKSGWSYKKIGLRMGVHPQSVVWWLSEKFRPSPMAVERIQKFLDEYYHE